MSAPWQVSAKYLKSMVAAMRTLGHFTRVEPALSPASRAAVAAPHTQSWWPGELLVELVTALGLETAREVSIRASRDGMGPLVRPLASVVLALSSSPFEALLLKLDTFVSAGVKGIETRVDFNESRTGATVSFVFPGPVAAEVAAVWTGLFDVGFSLARAGRVVNELPEPTTHRFELAW